MIISRTWRSPQSFVLYTTKRYLKKRWSPHSKKTTNVARALNHFDDFYGSIFGKKWDSMREALFRKPKYVALVNNFGDEEETKALLTKLGAYNMREVFNSQKAFDKSIGKESKFAAPDANNCVDRVESFSTQKKVSEISEVYGGVADGAIPTTLDVGGAVIDSGASGEAPLPVPSKASQISLGTALNEAEYDESRIIDPSLGMSASALWTFVPTTKIKGLEDWIPESQYFGYYEKSKDFPLTIEEDDDFEFPEHLNAYSFEPDNMSLFPHPKIGTTGVTNYYCMDGGSLLPVLALGLKPKDKVLDLCAAPGGKSLIILQTHLPDILYSNDEKLSRVNRLRRTFQEFLYDFDTSNSWQEKVFLTNFDGRYFKGGEGFDKVLVDAPCTQDRHSLKEQENSIFNPMRTRERIVLPEVQSDLLCNGLKLCRVGGCVVYSTCTLSPIQNDGVVHMALKKAFENHGIKGTIKLMNSTFEHASSLFRLGWGNALPKYGTLVTPHISANYGPTYFAKIIRTH